MFQVHNEAIVIPETIDCIRALSGLEADAARSMATTDAALRVVNGFFPASANGTAAVPSGGWFKGSEEPAQPYQPPRNAQCPPARGRDDQCTAAICQFPSTRRSAMSSAPSRSSCRPL